MRCRECCEMGKPICAAAAKSLQSCPTLCDPIDGSPPGSPVPGVLQARTLEWVAISSLMHESEKWKWSCLVVSDSSRPHGLQPTRLLHPCDFPGKGTGVGCRCLLQGIRVVSALFHDEATSKQSLPFRKHLINICWMRSPRKVKTKATWTSYYKLLIEQYPKRFITIRTMLRPSILCILLYSMWFFFRNYELHYIKPWGFKVNNNGSSEASP